MVMPTVETDYRNTASGQKNRDIFGCLCSKLFVELLVKLLALK